jgi:DNA-directed RNA polymerase specialized sigma24 family protein
MSLLIESDMILSLPLLEQIENMKLRMSLKRAKERDLYIFLAKVLEGHSLTEIAAELGISYNTTASIYYRMIDRLKKELGGEK